MITLLFKQMLLLFAVGIMLVNCASTSDEQYKQRGKLSEAMEKSSDEYKKNRRVANTYQQPQDIDRERYDNTNNGQDNSPGLFSLIADILLTPSKETDNEKENYKPHKTLYSEPSLPVQISTLPADPSIKSVEVTVIDSSGKRRFFNISRKDEEVVRPELVEEHKPSYSTPYNNRKKVGEWDVKKSELNSYFGFRLENGLVYSNRISGATIMSFVYANHDVPKRRWSLDAGFGYSPVNLESELSKSINGYYEGHIGFQHRWYSTPDYTWMGLFFLMGADLRFMSWNYNNPVSSHVYNEYGEFVGIDNIASDGLNGVNGQIGLGWSFLQTHHAKFSLELTLNGSVYGFSTWEGFDNDVFPASGQTKLTFEVVFGGKDKDMH